MTFSGIRPLYSPHIAGTAIISNWFPRKSTKCFLFRPSTAPLPALFAAKRGFFAPNARRTRPRRAPERPVLPRRRPVFARRAPGKAPAARPEARCAHSPGYPEAPACAAFCPACARPCAARRPKKPRRRRNPACQARRPARCRRPQPRVSPPAPPRHSLWARKPRLPWSAFPLRRGEVCDPKGGIRSLGICWS